MINATKKVPLVNGYQSGRQTAILNSYRVGLIQKTIFEQRFQGGKGLPSRHLGAGCARPG